MDVILAAFVMGLVGSGHCLGMCGGVSAALAFAIPGARRKTLLVLAYNLGRVASYGLMGLIFGSLVAATPSTGLPLARLLAGGLLIVTGLYLANIWRLLGQLERLGGQLWRYLQPLSQRLLPVDNIGKALVFGAIWGWLPCGLVYAALLYAVAQNNSQTAAAVMLAFGAGTLPAVMAGGLMAAHIKPLLQRRRVQQLLAIAYIGFGVWTLYGALAHTGHSGHEHRHESIPAVDAPAEGMEHQHHPAD